MIYRYRWLLAVMVTVLGLLIGYQLDLKHQWNQQRNLIADESDIRLQLELYQQLQNTETAHRSIPDVHRQSKLLRELLKIIESNTITLEYVARDDHVAVDEIYQLRLKSSYASLLNFFHALAQFDRKYTLMNFVFAVNAEGDIQVEMLLKIKNVNTFLDQSILIDAVNNPFCVVSHSMIMGGGIDRAMQFPMSDSRLIGTIFHDQQFDAVMLFPDGTIAAVSKQQTLGKEGGRVIAINNDSLTLLLPDQSQFVINAR